MYLGECDGAKHLFSLIISTPLLFSHNNNNSDIDDRSLKTDLVRNNTLIIDCHRNWNILLFKEVIKLKRNTTIIKLRCDSLYTCKSFFYFFRLRIACLSRGLNHHHGISKSFYCTFSIYVSTNSQSQALYPWCRQTNHPFFCCEEVIFMCGI